MLHWQQDGLGPVPSHLQVSKLSSFVRSDFFPGLEDALCARIARLTIDALRVARMSISPTTRRAVISETRSLFCYLCGCRLNASAQSGPEFLTLDHLWPRSLGGDSDAENLLPACLACQNAKGDGPSWEWINIHNLVIPAVPSPDVLSTLSRTVRIARHCYHVMATCESSRISLKKGFRRTGPAGAITCAETGRPATFFDLRTTGEHS